MKIVVWRGCVVENELDFPGTAGPDLHVDPWNLPESLSVRRSSGPGGGEISEMVPLATVAQP